ncbi:MAG: hypothetical protein GF317_15460 [Candidatus Lokiarchaeota archaeon]|nr:hypothetical protein [Candidatus Lokiarchaeota archaeon]MBD3200963.1 hypothetical protein [Candidatus Lokiarchaeota archaeon]
MVKLNLKGKEWLFILIAGILAIIVVIVPAFILPNLSGSSGNQYLLWVIGYVLQIDNGVIDLNDSGFQEGSVAVAGGIFSILLMIIGLILIISAIMTKFTTKQLPFKAYIWLFAGLFLFISPYLLRLGYIAGGLDEGVYGFGYGFDLYSPFMSFAGLFGMVFGMQEFKKER